MAEIRDLKLGDGRCIPAALLTLRFARSGGPGGQNVNKVASKVHLRLDLDRLAGILGDDDLARVKKKLAARIDAEGRVQIICSEFRDQLRNVEGAQQRMELLLSQALKRPKKRRATKPSKASKDRRIQAKKHRSQIKKWRSSQPDH